jgi:L-malate glycosyltransferase
MVRAISEAAARRGWKAELDFPPRAEGRPWFEQLRSDSAAVVRTVPDGSRWETASRIRSRLDERPGPVLLHTHFTRYDVAAVLAARGRPDTAVLWHIHTPLYKSLRRRLQSAVKFRLFGRSVAAILVSGPDPAQGAIAAGASRERVEIVGNGIDTARFPLVTPQERLAARDRLGLPQGARVLLHFGWNWHLKDGDLFLATVRSLLERVGDQAEVLALTVRGDDEARAGIARLELEGHARVIESSDDVRTLYGASDLFISTSRVEGLPFAVIEAICTGLPVVATDLPGHLNICGGLSSCRVTERSSEALADACAELLARPPADVRESATEARSRVAARFDLRAWTERMMERYERCFEGLRPG